MKIAFRFLFIFMLFLSLSNCKNDDNAPIEVLNVAPEQVTGINAEVAPNTAIVGITWNAAIDADGDEVRYDVIINKELVETNLSTTATEVDVSQFLTITGKQSLVSKGLELTLEIGIKAYDPSSSFSNASITKTLSINRQPTDFAFEEIIFDTDSYTQLDLSWTLATDADRDTLTYTVYLNDYALVENYEVPTGEEFGSLQYIDDLLLLLSNEPVTVKVVVTDSSGETKEISQSFDFKGTDVDLGALEAPYNEEVQFNIAETEHDNRLGYHFSLTKQTNYSIANSENAMMQIKAHNTTLVSGNSLQGVLEPGDYTLIVLGESGLVSNGSITFDLTSSNLTDVDLGVVVVPSENVYDLQFEGELDNTINYYFEVSEYTGYEIGNRYSNMIVNLYNQNGELVQTNYEDGERVKEVIYSEELPLGKYKLELILERGGLVQLNMIFSSLSHTDQDLGVLENNSYYPISFTSEIPEIDNEVIFSFETTEMTSFLMASAIIDPVYGFALFDSEGTSYGEYNLYAYLVAHNLPAGRYNLRLRINPSRYGELSFEGRFFLQNVR